jgi:hypothetical protein
MDTILMMFCISSGEYSAFNMDCTCTWASTMFVLHYPNEKRGGKSAGLWWILQLNWARRKFDISHNEQNRRYKIGWSWIFHGFIHIDMTLDCKFRTWIINLLYWFEKYCSCWWVLQIKLHLCHYWWQLLLYSGTYLFQ